MASFTINGGTQFPEGTAVGAYLRNQWPVEGIKGAPSGSPVATATVTSGTATFTGLADATRYVAYAQVGGVDRYERLQTDPAATATGSGSGPTLTLAQLKATGGPFVTAHRGGGANIAPENTLKGIVQAIEMGVPVINVDVWQGADGGLILCHDATLDRTTTATGNCEDATAQLTKSALVDADAWFAPGWQSQPMPTLDEVLALCKQAGVCMSIEVKSATSTRPGVMTAIVNKVVEYGMQSAVMLHNPNTVNMPSAAANSAGIIMGYIAGGATPSVSTLQGWGVTWITFDFSNAANTSSYLATLAAAGMWLDAWTIKRRTDWTAAVALGARSAVSDDPLYTQGNSPYMTKDPWAAQTYSHGMVPAGTNRGTFFKTANGSWFTIAGQAAVLQGWGSRAGYQTSISFTQRYETITTDATKFGYIGICCVDDSIYNDGAGVGAGYTCMLRQDGRLQIYVRGGGSPLATLTTTAPTAKQEVPLKIDITGTTVKLTRTDTGDNVTATDSTYRGGYWHLGVNDGSSSGVQASWRSVTLT